MKLVIICLLLIIIGFVIGCEELSDDNILIPQFSTSTTETVDTNYFANKSFGPEFFFEAYLKVLVERFLQNKSNNLSSHRKYSDALQIVICYEGEYGKAVCKLADPSLVDDNFEVWDYPSHPDTIFRSIYDRYKNLPLSKWPIICIPTANYESVNDLITVHYPNMAVVMPYIYASSWFPNGYNHPTNKVFKPVLVAGGNQYNDWTSGNKLDFIDSVNIQYMNPLPVYNYIITDVQNIGGYTRIYGPILPWYASVGSQVWFNILGSSGSFYQSYCILEKSTTEGWVKIYQQNVVGFQSGTAKQHYLSGSTFSNGAYLNKIMRKCNITYPITVKLARMTASNRGIRNNNTGFGRINVKDAISTYSPKL